jgi:hypothetical protein
MIHAPNYSEAIIFSNGTLTSFPQEVDLAASRPPKLTAENYADYPLIICDRTHETEGARTTADRKGISAATGR